MAQRIQSKSIAVILCIGKRLHIGNTHLLSEKNPNCFDIKVKTNAHYNLYHVLPSTQTRRNRCYCINLRIIVVLCNVEYAIKRTRIV